MSDGGRETEAKFYVRGLERVRSRLEARNARRIQERILETNIRFDLPGAPLRAEGRVLRLRQDASTKLTYKSASTNEQGVLSREEIEFGVDDFDKAKRFLEALGYQKLIYYEKYRTTYEWNDAFIMLDELPYGSFVEIEGGTVGSIRAIADQLNLKWETAVGTSYTALLERVRTNLHIAFEDLSFAEFSGVQVDAVHLNVHAADA
ncbi:MAG TPA: class IV adenylate cyclase [Anaerolineales bacterium]|nr:class IV adenylate cyclase [Anaerolineales bacterium]